MTTFEKTAVPRPVSTNDWQIFNILDAWDDGVCTTHVAIELIEKKIDQARTQAIDDCIKVAHEVAVMLGKFHGPSKPRSEIYRAEGANIVASRLESLKPASSGEK